MNWLSRFAALVFGVMLALAALAQADELQEVTRLMKQGQHAQALDRVNAMLATRPRDAQGRFLKGLILTEQNKITEAIEVFTRLSQDYPELPEPYNNLAVLHAAQGQYEKARQSLEMSIRTHPSYATAYENLGDVYTKLASQAYDKALQLDSGNAAAQSKLSLIRDLLTTTSRVPRPGASVAAAARAEPQRVAAADPAKSGAAPGAKAAAPPAEAKPAVASAAKAAPPEPRTAGANGRQAAKAPEKQPETGKSDNEDIVNSVRAWAAAWAKKDVDAYLAHYARDFKTPGGETRAAWEAMRRARITAPKKIEVSVESPKVTREGDGDALVSFRQHYRSDALKASSSKTLVMVRANGKWLIRQERVGS